MSDLPVDRCVCVNVTFAQMLTHVQREGGDEESLRRIFGCGGGCALCVSYIRMMLTTGRTRFAVDGAASRDSPPASEPPL